MRGRPLRLYVPGIRPIFQSTPPCGGDVSLTREILKADISIHAPMRGRPQYHAGTATPEDFNPRPHAGATLRLLEVISTKEFQSTPPCGGDCITLIRIMCRGISIHAPMRGRPLFSLQPDTPSLFQSTPPCGGDVLDGFEFRAQI